MSMAPALLVGQVMHHRLRPAVHRFSYPVFQLLLDPAHPRALDNAMLGVDRPGVLGFRLKDHGPRDGGPLAPWLMTVLKQHDLDQHVQQLQLQTFPRVLGYAFNPVSFWFCLDAEGRLRAVLAEVNNTFGEHHSYLLAHPDGRPISHRDRLNTRKVFHVSPFCQVEGQYEFQFRLLADGRRSVRIRYSDGEGLLLDTLITTRPQPYSARSLLGTLLRQPLQAQGIWLRIHWQALRLWLKSTPIFHKPNPPCEEMSR